MSLELRLWHSHLVYRSWCLGDFYLFCLLVGDGGDLKNNIRSIPSVAIYRICPIAHAWSALNFFLLNKLESFRLFQETTSMRRI